MKRLVDTKFTDDQERFINQSEGEVWTSNLKCPKCGHSWVPRKKSHLGQCEVKQVTTRY